MIFSKDELLDVFGQMVEYAVDDICVNSNDVKSGDLFIALKGERIDGHDFIQQALDNGASLVISEKSSVTSSDKVIYVKSSYGALLNLANYNIAKCNGEYIGVTGSVGKTTTKNLIYHILSTQSECKVYVTRKNFNSQIGLPICVATMPRDTKFGIFEMGMTSYDEIKKLVGIVQPSISVISYVGEAHLASFSSIFDIAKAKSEIFETDEPQKVAIIPSDSPYTDFLRERAVKRGIKKIFTFGLQNADARIINNNRTDGFDEITAEICGTRIDYRMHGGNNSIIFNSLSSILAANMISGISLQKLASAVESFDSFSGRWHVIYMNNLILIDDSYNACPASVKSAIQSLVKYKNRRKILVLGDMLELGQNAIFYHENLSATIDKFGIDLVFACGSLSKQLFDNLRDCKKGGWSENSIKLSEEVLKEIHNDDCILVKGSRSMNMDYVVNAIMANHVL